MAVIGYASITNANAYVKNVMEVIYVLIKNNEIFAFYVILTEPVNTVNSSTSVIPVTSPIASPVIVSYTPTKRFHNAIASKSITWAMRFKRSLVRA